MKDQKVGFLEGLQMIANILGGVSRFTDNTIEKQHKGFIACMKSCQYGSGRITRDEHDEAVDDYFNTK